MGYTINTLAMFLNSNFAKLGYFSDNMAKAYIAKKDMPNYRKILQDLYDISKSEYNNENREVFQALQAIHAQAILSDLTGETYIYQILEYGMEAFDFRNTDDFSGCIYKMGFTVDDFIGSIRLKKGLYTVFMRHYPDRLKQMKYASLFYGLDKDIDKAINDIYILTSAQRQVPLKEISVDDIDEFIRANQEIMDLYFALGNCVELALSFPSGYKNGKCFPAITSSDPLLDGALILYENGEYVLCQNVNDFLVNKALKTRVARFTDIEKAKYAGKLMFNHSQLKEKTFVIPLSSTSYAKTVYPFKDFGICYPEGENGELSSSQLACAFSMRIFFDMMSDESREQLRVT